MENPDGWDLIPGARGCTPQSCAFRDHFGALKSLGVDHVFGLSTQDCAYQAEAARRLHLPFPGSSRTYVISRWRCDAPAGFRNEWPDDLLKRLTLVIDCGLIEHVFYPVFPPDQNAGEVLSWLAAR